LRDDDGGKAGETRIALAQGRPRTLRRDFADDARHHRILRPQRIKPRLHRRFAVEYHPPPPWLMLFANARTIEGPRA